MTLHRPSASPARGWYGAVLLLVLLGVAWNAGLRLATGWSADDGGHLLFSAAHPAAHYLFDPALLWQASHANLTPLLNLFYSANLALFGLSPAGWRASMAVLAVAAVLSFHLAARQYMGRALALGLAAAWGLSVPFFYTTATFMTAHYVFGMVMAMLCVWAFAHWMKGGAGWLALAAVCYGLAVFSKEVYAPLPALLLLHAPWRRALAGMVPMALIALAYLGCRRQVLGSVVGGYRAGDFFGSGDGKAELLARVVQLPVTLFGGPWQAAAFGLACALFAWRATPRARLALALVPVLALLPLLPLLSAAALSEPDRYFFAAAAALLFVFGVVVRSACARGRCPAWTVVPACALVLGLALHQHLLRVPGLVAGIDKQAAVYRHALGSASPMVLLNPGLPADDLYWSQVLTAARAAQARLAGAVDGAPVLVVADAARPVVAGLHACGVPVYRYRPAAAPPFFLPFAPDVAQGREPASCTALLQAMAEQAGAGR